MKSLVKWTGILVLAVLFLAPACKKGADDPAISLRSRKARITGVWKLSDANYLEASKNRTTTYSYDNTSNIMTANYTVGSISYSENYTYSRTLTINKDYTFTDVEVEDNNKTITTEGYWYFAPGIKDLDIKNKERVVFQITKITVDDEGDVSYDIYNGSSNSKTTVIDLQKLSDKQITLNLDYTHSDEDGLISNVSGQLVFQQD